MPGTERPNLAQLWLGRGEPARSGTVKKLWRWLADPARADAERAHFANCAWPASHPDQTQAAADRGTVTEWLPIIAELIDHQPGAGGRGRHAAMRSSLRKAACADCSPGQGGSGRPPAVTLALAVLHGLLFDLLTTGDQARIERAFDLFGTVLDAIAAEPDP